MRGTAVLIGGTISLLLLNGTAFADACIPKVAASLDMIDEPDGRVAVAVGIAGAPHRMLIGTTATHSEMFEPAVAAGGYRTLGLSQSTTFDVFGGHASGYTQVDSLTLGAMLGGKVDMLVTPGPYAADPDVAGVLGADLLGNFDLDLDFAKHKVNFLVPGSCANGFAGLGEPFTSLPMADAIGGSLRAGARSPVTTPMMLDGKPVAVALDTLAIAMRMRFDVAKARFGLTATSPGMTPLPESRAGNPAYRYQFHVLTADGIAIDAPKIVLTGDPDALPCNGAAHPRLGALEGTFSTYTCRTGGDLTVGVHWMRRMHWVFAYKSGTIHFAAAH